MKNKIFLLSLISKLIFKMKTPAPIFKDSYFWMALLILMKKIHLFEVNFLENKKKKIFFFFWKKQLYSILFVKSKILYKFI
jgi:hypothetical protein